MGDGGGEEEPGQFSKSIRLCDSSATRFSFLSTTFFFLVVVDDDRHQGNNRRADFTPEISTERPAPPPRSSCQFSLQGSTRPSCCLSRRGRARIRSREEAASRKIEAQAKKQNKMIHHHPSAPPPAPPRLAGERRVALCVKNWSSDASLVTWAFVKNWFLRVREEERRAREKRQGSIFFSMVVR